MVSRSKMSRSATGISTTSSFRWARDLWRLFSKSTRVGRSQWSAADGCSLELPFSSIVAEQLPGGDMCIYCNKKQARWRVGEENGPGRVEIYILCVC